MKSRQLFIVIAIVGLVFFLLFKRTTKKNKVEESEAEVTEPSGTKKISTEVPSSPSVPVASSSAPELNQQDAAVQEALAVKFSESLSQMSKCLGLSNMAVPAAKVAPVADNLVGSIRSSLGDAVVQMEDWSQTEVIEKNGTTKRIRVDYDYPDGVNPVRRLSMFTINSYGAPELQDLSDEEANNPNEAYVQSLTEGLKVNADERAGRVYFSQGEELVFTMKNGKLQNFSFTRGNKNFSCSDFADEASRCICP